MLSDDWKKVKKAFETATGKKKPSEKLLGVFRKSSGLEAALKKVDGAKTKAACKTAVNEFAKAKNDYIKILKANQVDSNDVDYKTEIDKMVLELNGIEVDAANRMNEFAD